MHELTCPSCNKASQYNFSDFLLMCPFCSSTFRFDVEDGHKEIYGDHYVIPNLIEAAGVKEVALEWLRRLHHKPGAINHEFFIIDVQGFSIPFWIVSLEAHTTWKGLVKRDPRSSRIPIAASQEYLMETGQFRRSYRWAISARSNICETWGLARLHEPPEEIEVEWDGFPIDSTLSRGRIIDEDLKSPYEARNFFDFRFANGVPIIGIQVAEEEGLRRAKNQVNLYHYKLAKLNVDYLLDHRTELEIAGIQLIHIPFWRVAYIYRPRNALRYFYRGSEKKVLIDGYGKGILQGELALVHTDKVKINAYVTSLSFLFFIFLGMIWHPAFFLVAIFALAVAAFSLYKVWEKKGKEEELKLIQLAKTFDQSKDEAKFSSA